MTRYCDVALPIPVDQVFTYGCDGLHPVVGGRVLVPFRREHLQGVVVGLHDFPPKAQARHVDRVIDSEAVLSSELLNLGDWIADYYVAPIGEVLRTMLPLNAELRRKVVYKITESGATQLKLPRQQSFHAAASADHTAIAVLELLAQEGDLPVEKLRTSVSATAPILNGLVTKNWIARESTLMPRDAGRPQQIAVLESDARLPQLNANQQTLLAELASAGGQLPVSAIRQMDLPSSTLGTLVRRGLVRLEDLPPEETLAAFELEDVNSPIPTENDLNPAQRELILQISAAIHAKNFQSFLLHGVTGSGKTAVYVAAMRRALDMGFSSLLLVPEIGLTPAVLSHLRSAFGAQAAVLHSSLGPQERTAQWHRIRRGDARVVIGTRSAVFAPISNLGLIVVDEEHDGSYKQMDLPRYHARDVAVMRAKLSGATVVLGSATPSLESWSNAQRGKYTLLSLPNRVARRPLPEISLIDMRREFAETGQEHLISRALAEQIEATLGRGEQAMLLLNRRGYSFVAMCRACGEKLQCENCAIALTYHRSAREIDIDAPPDAQNHRLECHYCGYRRNVPKRCPNCDSEHIYFFGVGSQQGEERLQQMFPHARIARMDRDTMRSYRDYRRVLSSMHTGEVNLLVGTQMIAKGHDIHGVTLVGVVGVDHALALPDFRSAERVFQLLTQVAGRGGRGEIPGRVLIQTYHQDHYAVRFAAENNYAGFVEHESRYRRFLHYPPNAVLANVLIEHTDAELASRWIGTLGRWFQNESLPGIRVLGPAAAPIARIKRVYRFHMILRAAARKQLAAAVRQMLAFAEAKQIPRRHLTVDVDPIQLM